MAAVSFLTGKRLSALLLCSVLVALAPAAASSVQADSLALSPSSATIGESVSATGCGFPVGAGGATVLVDGVSATVSSMTASGSAGCYVVTFAVPGLGSGVTSVDVFVTIGTASDNGTLTVESSSTGIGTLTLSPGSAAIGQQVTATGCGFPVGSGSATVYVDGMAASTTSVAQTGGSGCYAVAFTVPDVTTSATSADVLVTIGTVAASGTLTVGGSSTGAGSLTLSPTSAAIGQQVTATGCGFLTGAGSATVYVAGVSITTTSLTPTGSTGCFSVTFTVPTVSFGSTSADVLMMVGSVVDEGTLQIGTSTAGTGSLTFSPASAAAGQQVTASGCGYPAGSGSATVYVEGTAADATSTMATGVSGCYDVAFLVPTLTSADTSATVLVMIGGVADSGSLIIGSSIAGTGGLTFAPTSAAVGQQVTASGCGFATGATSAMVSVDGLAATESGITETTTPGCYDVAFIVPALTSGTTSADVLVMIGGITDSATLPIGTTSSTAALTALPATVAAGASFTVTGSGFTADSWVTVSAFGSSQSATPIGGTFTATVSVPVTTTAGDYTVSAVSTAGDNASTGISVTAPSIEFETSPDSAVPGQTIAISGTGFIAGEQVAISLAQASAAPAAIASTMQVFQADSTGSIYDVQYMVPNVDAADYLLLAAGQTSGKIQVTAFSVLAGATTATETATAQPSPTETPTITASPSPTASPSATVPVLPTIGTAPSTTYFAEGYTGTSEVDGKVTFVEQLYFFNPTSTTAEVTTRYAVYDSATRSSTIVAKQDTIAPGATISRSVNNDVGNDRIVSATVRSSTGVLAEEVINRTRSDGTQLDGGSSPGLAKLADTWYLAEGSAGQSFQEYAVLYNPGSTASKAEIRYLPSGAPVPAAMPVTVPAGGQTTINVAGLYDKMMPTGSRDIALQVTSDRPIAVDRVMYWGAGDGSAKYGFSMAPAIATGSTSQSFSSLPSASGSQAFVAVLNPNSGVANVSLKLLDASGNILATAQAATEGSQRHTFDVASILPGDHGNVTGILSSDTPVIAEAPIYFGGSPNAGSIPGMVEQGSNGSLDGATVDLSAGPALLRVYNPGGSAVRVQVSLGSSAGNAAAFDGSVAAGTTKDVQVSSAGEAQGIILLASGDVASAFVSGGVGSSSIYGEQLT